LPYFSIINFDFILIWSMKKHLMIHSCVSVIYIYSNRLNYFLPFLFLRSSSFCQCSLTCPIFFIIILNIICPSIYLFVFSNIFCCWLRILVNQWKVTFYFFFFVDYLRGSSRHVNTKKNYSENWFWYFFSDGRPWWFRRC
jgi:hypothetical protein